MGSDRPVDRCALEVAEAVHDVPVALDAPRILADRMPRVGLDGGAGRFEMPPGPGLANPHDAGVGLDPDEQELADRKGADGSDPHPALPARTALKGRARGAGSRLPGDR